MSEKTTGALMSKFMGVRVKVDKLRDVIKGVIDGDKEISDPEIYDLAYGAFVKLDELIEFLEDNDNNLDSNKSKIPSMDEYFKDDPVTQYINNQLEALENKVKGESPHQDEKHLREFVDFIVTRLNINSVTEDYINIFKTKLLSSFKYVIDSRESCIFAVPIGNETVEGLIKIDENTLVVLIDHKTFSLELGTGTIEIIRYEPSRLQVDEYREENLLNKIEEIEKDYYDKINSIMDEIEDRLSNKKKYTDQDILLIKSYLRNLPTFSDSDVLDMTDDQAAYVFRYRMYSLGKLK